MRYIKIQVSGKVQGVWFRVSTRNKAQALGIQGIVRNLPNGAVYIEAQGNAEAIEEFVNWCWEGPELAQVDQVEVEEIESSDFEDFQIVR